MLTFLVYGICGGIALASLYLFYQKSVPGSLVRALLKAEALSPETAKPLDDLGLRFLELLSFELHHSLALRKLVHVKESEEGPLYYIPEELKYRAELQFEKKGSEILRLILTVLLSAALAVLLLKSIPFALSIIDSVL